MKQITLLVSLIFSSLCIGSPIISKHKLNSVMTNGEVSMTCKSHDNCSYTLRVSEYLMTLVLEAGEDANLPKIIEIPLRHGSICHRIDYQRCVYTEVVEFSSKCERINHHKRTRGYCPTRTYPGSYDRTTSIMLGINKSTVEPSTPFSQVSKISISNVNERIRLKLTLQGKENLQLDLEELLDR